MLRKIKRRIEKITKKFDLKYDEKIFKVVFLPRKELYLINYLCMCPDPIFEKYGKSFRKRVKNLKKFVEQDLKKVCKKPGGAVISWKDLKKIRKFIKKELFQKIEKSKTIKNLIVIVSLPKNRFSYYTILFHEWLHLLLLFNHIVFQRKRRNWELDEGLVTYLQISSRLKKLNISAYLKKKITKSKNELEKIYLEKALFFNNVFKNTKTPKERRRILIRLLNQYKKSLEHRNPTL